MGTQYEDGVAVVTGGNSGIGLSIARRLAEDGARVVLFGRDETTLEDAAREIGERAAWIRGDVRNLADLDRLYADVRQRHGTIDTLVVNAGAVTFVPAETTDEDTFDRLNEINFKGAFFTVQKALPLLRDGGSIVLVSSVVNGKGIAGAAVYSATKAAVRSLARTFANELAPRRIRVNVVSPGPIETPIFDRAGIPADQVAGTKASFAGLVPLGRMGRPEEVAAVTAFLAGDEATYVTGAEIAVDGGFAQV
jgi:NAD(P)-dependent dehydrogenase (short-subunit alcohol dehydrogenase family)